MKGTRKRHQRKNELLLIKFRDPMIFEGFQTQWFKIFHIKVGGDLSFSQTQPIVDPKLILGIRITKPP